jgi:hypothetical protein
LLVANNNMTNGKPAVWLTERDTLVPTLKTRRILLSRGILCGPGCSNLPDATVCLRAVIPSHDRKLTHWLSWLQKRLHGYDLDDALLLEDGIHNWVYFGDIPPARLTVFKHVPRTEPYWELPHHEAWRLTGAVAAFDPPELEADLLAGRAGPPKYVVAMRGVAMRGVMGDPPAEGGISVLVATAASPQAIAKDLWHELGADVRAKTDEARDAS